MPEISEVELAELMRLKGVAEKINSDPEARELLQRAAAKAMPDQVGPEIRIRQEVDTRLGSIEKKFDEFLAARTKEREDETAGRQKADFEKRWLEGRSFARQAGYTDDGMKALEEFMEREGIASHKHAIAAFERENPPAPAPVTGNYGFNHFEPSPDTGVTDDAFKALMEGNDDAFLAMTLPGALSAGRTGR